ncbi:MAG: outer membrane PBP1 activator LpoA protein [Saprospiraceae bacterium]|jgi:outer membrane PBP1 activator LpoA protein
MARKRLFNLFTATILAFLLNACSSTQTELPPVDVIEPTPPTETIAPTTEAPEATTSALDDEVLSEQALAIKVDPWKLVEQADAQTNLSAKSTLLFKASKVFLDQGHVSTAESVLSQVDIQNLNPDQAYEYQLIRAQFKFLFGDTLAAQQLLRALSVAPITTKLQADILDLQADILTSQLQYEQAIESRLLLGDLLADEAADTNLTKLYALLNQLSKPQLYQLERNVNHADLAGWIELVEQRRDGHMDDHAWIRWQQRHISHPVNPSLFINDSQSIAANISANSIALLLPLTSGLGHAAEAFRAGFFEAEREATGQNRSRVYDIGAESDLSPLYYRSAINDGADFVVGPLGRQAVKVLHEQPNLPVPTLLVGLLPENSPHLNAWGLGLSPEQDAQAIAEKAIQSGLKSAVILRKNNAWGERVALAFSKAFSEKGGSIKAEQRYLLDNEDIAISVKNVLTINDSEIRHKRLEQLLDRRLEHSVRRRDDVDFVFVATSAGDARKIVPLLKFYRAHDLPLFATSSVFSGKFNKISDADLNGLSFVDLPWLLNGLVDSDSDLKLNLNWDLDEELKPNTDSNTNPDIATEADLTSNTPLLVTTTQDILKYGGSSLDRLYALGYAAYEVIPQMARLQADPWQQFKGKTMSLRLDQHRNLNHESTWAKFTQDGVNVSVHDKESPQ